jgi:hypothetical protein
MASYKTSQAERVFNKLEVEEGGSDHHRRGFIIDEASGRKLFPPVYFNKGRGDIYPKLATKMRRALFLDQNEFDELMRCSMKKSAYFEIRRRRDP